MTMNSAGYSLERCGVCVKILYGKDTWTDTTWTHIGFWSRNDGWKAIFLFEREKYKKGYLLFFPVDNNAFLCTHVISLCLYRTEKSKYLLKCLYLTRQYLSLSAEVTIPFIEHINKCCYCKYCHEEYKKGIHSVMKGFH